MEVFPARPALVGLPEELISNIAARLGPDDIFNFRLTCRTVEIKSLHEFATEYFSQKGFIFTTDSLKVLANIANSAKLSKYLHDISFCAGYFSDPVWRCLNDCSCWTPNIREAEAHREYYNDQQKLIRTGGDKALIVEAFKNLPALEHLSIIDSYSQLPSAVDIRGFRKVPRLTGHSPTLALGDTGSRKTDDAYLRFVSHVWRTTMKSIVDSGINTLVSLDTNMKCKRQGLVAKDLQFSDEERFALWKAFANIKHLRIYLKARLFSLDKDHRKTIDACKIVQKFASIFKGRVHDFEFASDGERSSGSLANAFVSQFDLSTLSTIKVHNLAIKEAIIMRTISAMPNAKKVEFSWVDLSVGSWLPILKALQKLKQLDHLHLMYCQEDGRKAYFLTQPDPHTRDEYGDEDYYDDMDDGFFDEDDTMPPLVDPLTNEVSPESPNATITTPDATSSTPLVHALYGDLTEAEKRVIDPNPAHKGIPLHIAPGCEDAGEIGYFVCISGENEVQRQLAIFVREYNVGHSAGEVDPFGPAGLFGGGMPPQPPPGVFGPPPPPGQGHDHSHGHGQGNGAAGQQALNGLLNQLATAFIPGGPPPPHTSAPNGTHANVHGNQNTAGGGQQNGGTGTQNGAAADGSNANTTTHPPQAPTVSQGTMPNGNPYLSASFPANWLHANTAPAGTGNTLGLNGGGGGLGMNNVTATPAASQATPGSQAPNTNINTNTYNNEGWESDYDSDDDDADGGVPFSPTPGNGDCAPS